MTLYFCLYTLIAVIPFYTVKNLELGSLHIKRNTCENFSVKSSPIFKRPSLSLRVPRLLPLSF
jgi:hypothetical protein